MKIKLNGNIVKFVTGSCFEKLLRSLSMTSILQSQAAFYHTKKTDQENGLMLECKGGVCWIPTKMKQYLICKCAGDNLKYLSIHSSTYLGNRIILEFI